MSQKSTNDIVGDNFYKELIQFQTDFTQNDHDSYVNVPETTRSDQAAETNSETSQQGILRDRKATTRLGDCAHAACRPQGNSVSRDSAVGTCPTGVHQISL